MVDRRSFMKILAAFGVTFTAGPLLYGAAIEPGQFEVVKKQIRLPRLGSGLDGLRIVQISDLHMGPFFDQEKLTRVVELILEQKPDLVFITGDFLTRGADLKSALADLSEPLTNLARRLPVFSVMGNHDFYGGNDIPLRSLLARTGITDVTNTIRTYKQNGDTLHIAGVGTYTTRDMRLARVTDQAPDDAAVVLLAHEPDVARWRKPKFIMQFSGHSHGGQINLVAGKPLYLPRMGELYPVGLYDLDGYLVYTNRGLGMTSLPLRINCPPEITVFNLSAG